MKAFVYRNYGGPDVLMCENIPRPFPAAGEVLLRVRAAALNPLDWHYLRGKPYGIRLGLGLRRPKNSCFGMDVAGVVVSTGPRVTGWQPGDEAFGLAKGVFAEYACSAQLIRKPRSLTFEQAAAVPVAGLTALQALKHHGRLQAGEDVIINGASGGVGTFAVQIAKYLGANVTSVCGPGNIQLVQSLGSDNIVDYTQKDLTELTQRYDLMVDCIGNHRLTVCRRILRPNGRYVMIGAPSGRWVAPLDRAFRARLISTFVSQTLLFFVARWDPGALALLSELMELKIIKPVIDRTYTLDKLPDAIAYIEGGHAHGKVVLTAFAA
jgi:NADPH:quinone reductase-like Zn-dependent oxidoreductase